MTIDKKMLRDQYKDSKPPMGCFSLTCEATGDMFIGWATDLKSAKNSLLFRLSLGSLLHEPRVQQLHTLYGADAFSFSILEELSHDKGHASNDYQKDLEVLTELYLEKYPDAKEIQVWKYPRH